MLALSDGVVVLRDFIEADIEDYVRWETVETEWKLWDAPWEHEGETDEAGAAALDEDVAWMRAHAREMASLRDDAPRRRFEICVAGGRDAEPRRNGRIVDGNGKVDNVDEDGESHRSEQCADAKRFRLTSDEMSPMTHIGGVSTYRIDDDFSIAENGSHLALGIDINSMMARGRGYAPRALRLFTDYLFERGERELYCQTWSGNTRMINLACRLGFIECCRKPGLREVRGQRYDGLTFLLKDHHAPDGR